MNILNKVIFIDNDPIINEYHRIFTRRLELANEVLFFESAEKTLEYLSQIKEQADFPELILIDINMPNMDGHTFVEKINKMPAFNTTRTMLAFLTSSKNMVDVVKADEENVDFYYWKPLNDKLIRTILKDGFGIDLPPGEEFLKVDFRQPSPRKYY